MPRYIRLARFVLVGATCYVLQVILFQLMLDANVPTFWAGYGAFGLSAQLNFVLSGQFTWRDRPALSLRHLLKRWLGFNAVVCVTATANASLVMFFATSLWHWLAIGIATGFTTVASLLISHYVLFTGGHVTPAIRTRHDGRPGVAFFMPAHNEADNLPEVVGLAQAYFRKAGLPLSLIVVDDGSTDNTAEVLALLQLQYGIEVKTHEVNKGYGAALQTGIQAAFNTQHEYIAFCDADGQFDPADIELLLQALESDDDADVAIGYREARADNLHRRMTGRVWHWLSSLVLGFSARDVDCGFKLFRRSAIACIDPMKLSGDHAVISPELLARFHYCGLGITEVAMPHYPRQHGLQSGVKLSVMLGSLVGLFRLRSIIRKEVRGIGNSYTVETSAEGFAA